MSDRENGAERRAAVPDETSRPEAAMSGETPHAFLRRVTRPWHEGVEAAFASFDLRTREGLSGFLLRQAAALFPLERSLERAGIADEVGDWPARRRAPALAADLARLDLDIPSRLDGPTLRTRFQRLGVLYVLEGSKLGGRVLHRRQQASSDPEVRAADAFLGHRHAHGWPSFLALLAAVPDEAEALADLREGARLAFTTFDAAARREAPGHFMAGPTRSGLYHQAHA